MHELTLFERAANAINTSWKYSWHWPPFGWEEKALGQAKERRADVIESFLKEVNRLDVVIAELGPIVKTQQEGSSHE